MNSFGFMQFFKTCHTLNHISQLLAVNQTYQDLSSLPILTFLNHQKVLGNIKTCWPAFSS